MEHTRSDFHDFHVLDLAYSDGHLSVLNLSEPFYHIPPYRTTNDLEANLLVMFVRLGPEPVIWMGLQCEVVSLHYEAVLLEEERRCLFTSLAADT